MLKTLRTLVWCSCAFALHASAFQSKLYEITPPGKAWKEMKDFVGTDVSMINLMTPGQVHVFSVTTINSPNAIGREKEFLAEEAAHMGSRPGRSSFEIAKTGKVKGAPPNHYVEFTYTQDGKKKQEIYVMFVGKQNQHYVSYANTIDLYPNYYEEFLKLARSFELR